jgi:hypothetical protein
MRTLVLLSVLFLSSFTPYQFSFEQCRSEQFSDCMHNHIGNSHICGINARMHCVEYYVEAKLLTRKQVNTCFYGYWYQRPDWCPER